MSKSAKKNAAKATTSTNIAANVVAAAPAKVESKAPKKSNKMTITSHEFDENDDDDEVRSINLFDHLSISLPLLLL
jgi:hypothetical protein